MKSKYTKTEMTRLWRERSGLDPFVAGCSVTRHDGVDIDAMIERRAREWYLGLLHSGERRYVAEEDISPRVVFEVDSYNVARCVLPLEVCRVFEARLSGWARSALVSSGPPVRLTAMLANPYFRGSLTAPQAWIEGDSLCLLPALAQHPQLNTADFIMAAVDSGADEFVIDDSALATIPYFNPFKTNLQS